MSIKEHQCYTFAIAKIDVIYDAMDDYLYGESMVALLRLCATDPRAIWVATPKRTRRDLGEGVRLIWRRRPDATAYYEGIRCQEVVGAIRAAEETLGPSRAARAAPGDYVMRPFGVKLSYLGKPWCTVHLEVGFDEIGNADHADVAR